MTIEELKVRLCEEIKFTGDGYKNMCEVLDEFSEAQQTAHNSDYAKCADEIMELFDSENNLYRHTLKSLLERHFA